MRSSDFERYIPPYRRNVPEKWRRPILASGIATPPIRLQEIAAVVERVFGVTFSDIAGEGRAAPVVKARGAFVALARNFTDHSYPEIAAFIRPAGRSHTGVLTAFQRSLWREIEDEGYAAALAACWRALKDHASLAKEGVAE